MNLHFSKQELSTKFIVPKIQKVFLFLLCISIISTLFVGCSGKQTSNTTGSKGSSSLQKKTNSPLKDTENTTTTVTKDSDDSKKTSTKTNDDSYNIKDNTYKTDDITISYPSITGMKDSKKQKELNAMIKDDFTSFGENSSSEFALPDGTNDAESYSLEITYRINYRTNHILSILVSGYFEDSLAAHPNAYEYGYTYDLEHVKKYSITDFVDVNIDFTKQLLNSYTYDGVDDSDDLFAYINEEKSSDILYDILYNTQRSYVLGDDYLGIILSVPHALGDNILIHIPYTVPSTVKYIPQTYLLKENENLIYGFQLADSKKHVLLAQDIDHNYMCYRFGTKDKTELSYPKTLNTSSYDQFNFTDNGDNVSFKNGIYQYKIYQTFNDQGYSTGIDVTNENTQSTTKIIGNYDTNVGYISRPYIN